MIIIIIIIIIICIIIIIITISNSFIIIIYISSLSVTYDNSIFITILYQEYLISSYVMSSIPPMLTGPSSFTYYYLAMIIT